MSGSLNDSRWGKAFDASLILLAFAASPASSAEDPIPLPSGSPSGVVISEILAANVRTTLDDEGKTPDWIELHNVSDRLVDLAGWKLSDDSAKPDKWTFPGVVLPPGSHYLVWASGKDRTATPLETVARSGAELPFERTFIAAGASWRYVVAEPGTRGPPADWAAFEHDDGGWARGPSGFGYADDDDATQVPEGTTAVFTRHRFTVADPRSIGRLVLRIRYDDGFVAYLNGTRVASSNSPVEDPDFSTIASDKHESAKAEPFDLTPHLAKLRAGENVLAIVGLNDRPSSDMSLIAELGTTALVCHTSFELGADGGQVILSAPGGQVADRLVYPQQFADRSYGRAESAAPSLGHFITPSPGLPNRFRAFAEPPEVTVSLDPPPGLHPGPVSVRLAAESKTPGVTLRYTLDGSEPTAASPEAREPLRLVSPTVVRVAPFLGPERASPGVGASYLIRERPPLPVLSVAMAPGEFEEVHVNQNAHGRPAERRAHVEIITPDGQRVAATVAGFRLHGGYGRRGGLETKKSYKLYFRGFYGEGRLKYAFIPGAPEKGLDKIVLRANFNDRLGSYHAGAAFLRDQVLRDLHRDMGALAVQGAWCLLYVNGEAKGLYNAVERPDDEMLAGHLGDKEWDVVKTGNDVAAGTREAWDALRRYALDHDLSQAACYEEVQRRVDLESFNSYMILNLWSQNEDWPGNNWYAARPRREDGKWIYLSWDAEWGLGNTPSGHQAQSLRSFFSKRSPIRDLFAALTTNAAYRERFRADVARHLGGALRPENVVKHVEAQRDAIAAVIPLELKLNAGGLPAAVWKRNAETVRQFAGLRNPYFGKLVARTLEPAANEDAAVRDRPVALERAGTGELWIVGRTAEGGLDAFRRAREGQPWARVAIDVAAARIASGLTGYSRDDRGSLHLLYRGEDGHIHQWSHTAGGEAATWQHEDITELAATAPAAGRIHVILSSVDGMPHVVYRDLAGQVHELWLETTWRHSCIGAVAAAARLTTGSLSLLVDPARKSLHVTFVGEDGHLHEISSPLRAPAPGRGRTWQAVDLMKDQGMMSTQGLVVSTVAPDGHRTCVIGPDGLLRGFLEQAGTWMPLPVIDGGSLEPIPMRPGSGHAWQPRGADGSWLLVFAEPEGRVRLRRFAGVDRSTLGLPAFRGPLAAGDPFAWSDARGTIHVAYRAAGGAWCHAAPVAGKWQADELR